jgi:small-conductance mechanosensitive channel
MNNTAERELEAKQLRITRDVHAVRASLPDQLHRLAQSLEQLEGMSVRSTDTSTKCERWQARVAEAQRRLEEFVTTARPALDTATDRLQQLTTLVEADERRRAGEAAEKARRRKLDNEVQRLADEEDAAEQAARRSRLEEQARSKLTGAKI